MTMEYKSKSTEELEAICCEAAERLDGGKSWEELEPILTELARRRRLEHPDAKSPEQALSEFWEHYCPLVRSADAEPTEEALLQEFQTPHELTPSPHGRDCLGNGLWPGYECQCPDCDWFQTICFPDWREMEE